MIEVFIWIICVLLITSLIAVIAKRHGVEYLIGTFVALVFIAIQWPAASFWNNQEAFELTLENTWRIVLGSLIAYIISQNHDIWSFNLWKKVTKGRYLWLRNTLSTILSQFIDTIIFVTIAFYGLFPVMPTMIGLFIVKVIIALLDNPFIYFVRWIYKKI